MSTEDRLDKLERDVRNLKRNLIIVGIATILAASRPDEHLPQGGRVAGGDFNKLNAIGFCLHDRCDQINRGESDARG